MSKRRAAPAAINTPAPAPTLPERIRHFVHQLLARAAQPGPDGKPDLELGGLAIALATVANEAEQEIAQLTLQRDLAQPSPTPWAYEQACKALRKHHDRAEALAAALREVLAAFSKVTLMGDAAAVGYIAEGPVAPEDFARWQAAAGTTPQTQTTEA